MQLVCAYSAAHLHINYNISRAPRRGGHAGKRGSAMEAAFPGRHGVPGEPWSGQGVQRQAWHHPGEQRFSLGCVRVRDTDRGAACLGRQSHRPLLFRHEFLSWHSCPQALHICLIPISLLRFKSTSLSGVITGQFSPHAKFRYCIYYLHVDLGDIVSQFPVR